MFDFLGRIKRLSRRALLGQSGLAAVTSLAGAAPAPAPAAGKSLRIGSDIYESIGVRPLINCRGTLTIIGGSLELDDVRKAKEAAALHFAHIDELMEAVGNRLAEITGAEFGMVSSGCAAAISHATAACVAGGNPDLHVRIPDLSGFQKDEVIIPAHSRNVYDAAVRAVGVKIIEVETREQLEAAMGPRTAMIYIFAGPRADSGPLATEAVCQAAKPHNIPVMVDAAAEVLTIPCVHLQKGATLVGYSGGKALRGPQCAGMLLGRKDLIKAAWMHSAPHHGYARAMKIGKEEIVGMLAAIEAWTKRDHKAEWQRWLSWLDTISKRVTQIEGVKTAVREPNELSNRTPSLTVTWDTNKIGITGAEVSDILYNTTPRIALGGGFGGRRRGGSASTETSISITAYMMSPGDEQIVADRVYRVLAQAPKTPKRFDPPKPPAADLTGRWDVEIQFVAGKTTHSLYLGQKGNQVEGTHQGEFITRELFGSIDGDAINFSSNQSERHGVALSFRFTGKVNGDEMSGALDMGEYQKATWTAKRHRYGRA